MSNLIPLVDQSTALSNDQKDRIRRYLKSNMTSYLAADKEAGPFMLYLMGQDLEQVSKASGYPFDVIAVTALHYQWEDKKSILSQNGGNVAVEMQRQIVNMMLVATYLNARNEMAELLSGKDDKKKSSLAARNLSGLKELMDMVMKMNGMVDAEGNPTVPQQAGTVIHAQNVQINNSSSPEEDKKRLEDKQRSRAEMLKELANKEGE